MPADVQFVLNEERAGGVSVLRLFAMGRAVGTAVQLRRQVDTAVAHQDADAAAATGGFLRAQLADLAQGRAFFVLDDLDAFVPLDKLAQGVHRHEHTGVLRVVLQGDGNPRADAADERIEVVQHLVFGLQAGGGRHHDAGGTGVHHPAGEGLEVVETHVAGTHEHTQGARSAADDALHDGHRLFMRQLVGLAQHA